MDKSRRARWMALVVAPMLLLAACGGRDSGESGSSPAQGSSGGSQAAATSPGITDTTIKIGTSYALSGNASAYSTVLRSIEAYFKYVNEELGGVKGADGKTRKLEIVALDDGYAPARTVENVKRLVEQDQVFALFSMLGTPTNSAIWDYANQQKVPHLFLATGASKWGSDIAGHPYTIGWQPAYATEAAIYGEYLKQERPNAKVALLTQNDDFGKDYSVAFEKAIEGSNVKIIARQSYASTDPTIDSQMQNLASSGADVFLNITISKFSSQSIRKKAELGWGALHLLSSVSASIESVLKPAGLPNAKDVVSAAYLKDATDPQWANDEGMKLYKQVGQKYGQFNVNDPYGVIGFAQSDTLVKTLQRMEAPNRDSLMKAVRSIENDTNPLLLPGIKINTGPDDGFPVESMQLERFDGTVWKLFGEVIDYEKKTPAGA